MKKFGLFFAIFLSIFSATAFAKTAGTYVGFDILRSSAVSDSYSTLASDSVARYSHKQKDAAIGFEINYKQAFNFDNFFIAPGLFYQRLNTRAKSSYVGSGGFNQSVNLSDAFGFKTDFGYDVNDKFSAYIPLGISKIYYDISTYDYDSTYIAKKTQYHRNSYLYGLGFSYALRDNILLNVEYNRFLPMKISSGLSATLNGGRIIAKTNLEMFKFGAAYKF